MPSSITKILHTLPKGTFALNLIGLMSGFFLVISQINILLGELSFYNPVAKENKPLSLFSSTTPGVLLGAISLALMLFSSYYLTGKKEVNRTKTARTTDILNSFVSGCILGSCLIICSRWQFLTHAYVADSLHARAALWLIPVFIIIYPLISVKNKVIIIPLLSLLLLPVLFILHTKASPLFSDDHGSVIYRLQLIQEYFPRIPLYNTEWNAGTDWRDFFATGILNIYLLFFPLFQIFSVDSAYSYIVIAILFLVLPISAYSGSQILLHSRSAAIFSALLSVIASSAWYKWALSYGSMGFVCSTALFPLLFALAVHTLKHKGETSRMYLTLLVIVGTLCLFWSAQGLSLIPLILLALVKIKPLLSQKRIRWTLAALVLINVPWMLLFVTVSKVGSFVQVESAEKDLNDTSYKIEKGAISDSTAVVKGRKKAVHAGTVIKAFRDNASKIHPLILLLSLPSLLILLIDPVSRLYLGIPFSLTATWLFFLSTVAVHIKPQLELDRMMLIASIVMCIPVGAMITRLLNTEHKSNTQAGLILARVSGAIVCSFLILGVLTTTSTLQNRSWEKYRLVDNSLTSLAQLIASNKGPGRTLFSGFILHELGGGHIAPLTRMSGAPILASSPVHNLWWYTDVIPELYREQGPAGIEAYLDLMNVSLVIAHERVWKDYFRNSSFRYDEVGIVDRFVAFRRNGGPDSYFLSGTGEIISQDGDGVRLSLKSDSAILKFNYYPFLEATDCKSINRHGVSEAINFISLEGCQVDQIITIRSVNPFRRLFH